MSSPRTFLLWLLWVYLLLSTLASLQTTALGKLLYLDKAHIPRLVYKAEATVYSNTVSFKLRTDVATTGHNDSIFIEDDFLDEDAEGSDDGNGLGNRGEMRHGLQTDKETSASPHAKFLARMPALDALDTYYHELTSDAFVLDTGGSIKVTVNAAAVFAIQKFQDYVQRYALKLSPPSPPSSVAAAANPDSMKSRNIHEEQAVRRRTARNTTALTGVDIVAGTDDIMRTNSNNEKSNTCVLPGWTSASRFFFHNQPRLHCLYNAPVLLDEVTEAAAAADGAHVSNNSLHDSACGDTTAAECASCLPTPESLLDRIPTQMDTRNFLLEEVVLMVKIFDADVWYRLTDGAEDEKEKMRIKSEQRQQQQQQNTNLEGEDAAAEGLEELIIYNLQVDPAKVCSTPAAYTIHINDLLHEAALLEDTPTIPSSPRPTSATIRHESVDVRVVAVLVQCSAVPLTVDISVTLENKKGRSGSAEHGITAVLYILFILLYMLLLIVFLGMILNCDKGKNKNITGSSSSRNKNSESAKSKSADETGTTNDNRSHNSSTRRSGGRERTASSHGEADSEGGSSSSTRKHRKKADGEGRASGESHQRHDTLDGGREDDAGVGFDGSLRSFTSQPTLSSSSSSLWSTSSYDSSLHTYSGSESDDTAAAARSAAPTAVGGGPHDARNDRLLCSRLVSSCYAAIVHFVVSASVAIRDCWKSNSIIVMYWPLQWIVLILIPLNCLICILRTAEFSILAGSSVVDSSFALPTVSIVLSACSVSGMFVLEMLIGMGWGLAYHSLTTVKVVILCVSTVIAFALYVLVSTCSSNGIATSFTSNRYVRAQTPTRCLVINYMNGAVTLIFQLHNAGQMLYVVFSLRSRVYTQNKTGPNMTVDQTTGAPVTAPSKTRASTSSPSSPRGDDDTKVKSKKKKKKKRKTRRDERHNQRSRSAGSSTHSSRSLRRRHRCKEERDGSVSSSSDSGTSSSDDDDAPSLSSTDTTSLSSRDSQDGLDKKEKTVQVRTMVLYLRYTSMCAPFMFLPLWTILFLCLSLTMYGPGDYYMQVLFVEAGHVYLLCFIVVFFRKKALYA